MLRGILNSPLFLCLILAVPGIVALSRFASGAADAIDMYHPTGEWAVRWMIVALAIGPLAAVIGTRPWLGWLIRRRRYFGLAAFAYALAHLCFYIIEMGTIGDIVEELALPGIWTGWLALMLMAVPAAISSDRAMRGLGALWKRLQRLVWPAAALALAHWLIIGWEALPALVHFAPLMLLFLHRFIATKRIPA